MQTVSTIKIFLMGVIAALLLTVILQDGRRAINGVNASDQTAAGGVIALTCPVKDKMGLVLIDTNAKNMAYYVGDDSSKFNMVAARHYGYDLGIKFLKYNQQGYAVAPDKEMPKGTFKNAFDAYKATANLSK